MLRMRNIIGAKSILFVFTLLCLSLKASAHNAVTYLDEGTIALFGFLALAFLVGLVSSIVCLFNEKPKLEIFVLVVTVFISALAVFIDIISRTSIGRGPAYPVIAVSIMWVLVILKKRNRATISSRPVLIGLLLGLFMLLFEKAFFGDYSRISITRIHFPLGYLFFSIPFIIITLGIRTYVKRQIAASALHLKGVLNLAFFTGIVFSGYDFIVNLGKGLREGYFLATLPLELKVFICSMVITFLICLIIYYSVFLVLTRNR